MRNKKESYLCVCRRCRRVFEAKHWNALYCDLPPEEGDKTCREIMYKSRSTRYKEKAKKLRKAIRMGHMLQTDRFGFISREEYFNQYISWMLEKKGFSSRAEYMDWREKNPEEDGLCADEFRNYAGVEYLFTDGEETE